MNLRIDMIDDRSRMNNYDESAKLSARGVDQGTGRGS